MSQLLILTRPSLVHGFHLAGVDAYGADTVESAQEQINRWIHAGESGLIAIDDYLFELLERKTIQDLESTENLPYLLIPGGQPMGPETSRRRMVAETIRRAIGFHITFKGGELEEEG